MHIIRHQKRRPVAYNGLAGSRMTFANPQSNLAQFELKPGLHVADLGAGSGFYTLLAAKQVRERGRVFAVEIQKDLLDRIRNEAARNELHNVEVIWGDIERRGGTRLRDESVDRVIASNILFQVDDKDSFVSEMHRILKTKGQALLIDWSDASSISGPDQNHVVSKRDAIDLLGRNGFALEREIHVGAHHYGLIFTKL